MTELQLPVAPTVVTRVIEIASDPEATISQLAQIIRMDSVLSINLLKAVNSPFYALRRKVASVEQATGLMGIRAVRNLVLCLSVKDLAPKRTNYPIDKFWEGSLRRAAAAKILARQKKMGEEEELFTLGLCQDLGVLVRLNKENSQGVTSMIEHVSDFAETRIAVEKQNGEGHDQLGFELFKSWDFPEYLCSAVRWHHHPDEAPDEYRIEARIAYAAEAIADLMQVEDTQEAMSNATKALAKLSLSEQVLPEMLEETGTAVQEAAQMLDVEIGKQPSYSEIMQKASEGLYNLNLSYQNLADKLESSLNEQRRMAEELQQLNRELEKRATTDELTGLPNRRAFDAGLVTELERGRRLGKPVALLMIDVDHFKKFNDTWGHQAGDAVLRQIGGQLAANARSCDLAARYGGEEFAVILPHTDGAGAFVAAERIRKAIEKTSVKFNESTLQVTASIGIGVVEDASAKRADIMLIREADDALYNAKEAGRNRVQINE
jgi:two-component system, cell cycle response regulator